MSEEPKSLLGRSPGIVEGPPVNHDIPETPRPDSGPPKPSEPAEKWSLAGPARIGVDEPISSDLFDVVGGIIALILCALFGVLAVGHYMFTVRSSPEAAEEAARVFHEVFPAVTILLSAAVTHYFASRNRRR